MLKILAKMLNPIYITADTIAARSLEMNERAYPVTEFSNELP